jgi:pimeloyl-ACP methyl ester carboxylesterase
VRADDDAWLAASVHEPATAPDVDAATIVLAHGWTLTQEAWAPVVTQLLEAGSRVVTFDQRGHGASPLHGPGLRHPAPTVRALGHDLAAVLRATVPDGPVVLGGHSMGGMTVLAYAGSHPSEVRERVRGVLLASTSAGDLAARAGRKEVVVMRLISYLPRRTAGRHITVDGQRRLLFGEEARPQDVQRTRDLAAGTRVATIGRFHTALTRHDETEALAALVDVPLRVVVGERDRLTPVAHAQRLVGLAPHADLDVLSRKGHMLPFEAPDELAAHLLRLAGMHG